MAPADDTRDAPARLNPVLFDLWLPRGPELSWQVLSLRGTEELARPYEFELELWCDDPDADFEQVLGADCELLLDRNGHERTIYGVIAEVELLFAAELRIDRDGIGARVKLVPAFRLLEQELDTRFYSGQSVIEILGELLGERLGAYEREIDVESRIKGEYNKRDYCVQFRESTLGFCSRIMEEEGIAYLFVPDRDAQRERMVLIDNNEDYAEVELLVPEPLVVELDRPEQLDRESLQGFHWRRLPAATRVLTRGYNYKLGARPDEGEAEDASEARAVARAQVHEGAQRQIIDDPLGDPDATSFDGSDLAQQAPLARRMLEAERAATAVGHGQSNAIGFCAGATFELDRQPVAGPRTSQFLLTRVVHGGGVSESTEGTRYAYTNQFECVPRDRVFRPARLTPKPRVYGVQTGVVVGKVPDEVHTDPLGRVRVAFHVHGSQPADEHASCWIRVAQIWAGPGYGAMVIPRVGMEVVVAFVDGDPDQPLITGCVYNGANSPPYKLPEQLSKSTFKSASTPGGEAFSEVRIEDAGGREQVFVRAQRRMDLRVQGTMYSTCTGDREELVGAPAEHGGEPPLHNVTTRGNLNALVEEEFIAKYVKDAHVTYNKDLLEVTKGRKLTWANELQQFNAPQIVTEASKIISHKSETILLGGSDTVSVMAGGKLVLESNGAIELRVGNSFLLLDQGGVELAGYGVRINSGGGVGHAEDALDSQDYECKLPLEALAADDGRIRPPGSGRGGRRRSRTNETWPVPQHRAPPMKPPPLPKQSEDYAFTDSGGMWKSIAWVTTEAWCSESVTLKFVAEDPPKGAHETAFVQNASDGEIVGAVHVDAQHGSFERSIVLKDIRPRTLETGVEDSRELDAWLSVGLTAPGSLRFRFIANLPLMMYDEGFAQFDIGIRGHEILINSMIPYIRGRMGYIISLGEFAPDDAGGLINQRIDGSDDWRYCKKITIDGDADRLAFWDGKDWRTVPKEWEKSDPLGNKLVGVGLWVEDGRVHTQYGNIPWPDDLPDWDPDSVTLLRNKLDYFSTVINEYWSNQFDLKRDQCQGHDPKCCRYRVRCDVGFFETNRRTRRTIIIGDNITRENSRAWSRSTDRQTAIHEFGHHLGNPDEYPGAATVNIWVHGDGAVMGLDKHSIMGSGEACRRRHYNTIAEALAKLVARETGKHYTYSPAEALK